MMLLLSSPSSPYVRKVRVTAGVKGLLDKIEMRPTDSTAGDDKLFSSNPLGKIPCLIPEGGEPIYDSAVICEYLDSLSPRPVLFPASGPARWKTLTLAGLADGILDAALLLVYEKRFRAEGMRVQAWIDRQQAKIDRAVDHLEKAPPAWSGNPDYGHITLACALGYLDFRHEGKWRARHPKLVQWLDTFDKSVPDFAKTKPVG
ncbi:MAG: glutathione S-transferase [Bacteroidota bacterium]|jgi:glutathione S-transferase